MKKLSCFGVVLGILVLCSSADAQENKMSFEKGDLYGNLGAGIFAMNDVGITRSTAGSLFGVTFAATTSATYTFETGTQLYGGVGYHITDDLSYELDLAYSSADYDSVAFSSTGVLTAIGVTATFAAAGTFNVDGTVSGTSAINNLVYTFGDSDITPYVGAGLGFLWWTDEIDRIGTLTVNGEETGTDPAANILAGVDMSLAGKTTVGLRYKYVWAGTGATGQDDVTLHALSANLRIPF